MAQTPESRLLAAAADIAAGGTRLPPARHRWLAPVDVRLEGDDLRYDLAATRARGGEITPTAGMLEGFVQLVVADNPEAFVRFARDYGVLGVCRHGAIYTHCLAIDDDEDDVIGISTTDNPADREPLAVWRRYARVARAALTASAELRGRNARGIKRELVTPLADYVNSVLPQFSTVTDLNRSDGRALLATALTQWLTEGDARLIVQWPARQSLPELTVGAPVPDVGAFTAIGMQLALACARAEGLATCSNCGVLHAPTRPPRSGQRTFCQACRDDGAPARLANRDRRARQRQEGAES